ncbi:class I histocompatibility antigen, F10 alpha chain-like isoform X2 [Malurus melanocephalus]|uniref:class I histocompatibility antigen, F10 alpha chain-like isoform X2 n=1 Tax=Malurus melanocephalus TaxID=175006 RepID=UPI002547BAC7|nr:class I histocompatibility antigen, F10 alpha chain-like isoform X2 [Malurus melanocephalus]
MIPPDPPNLRVPPVLHSLRYRGVAVSEPGPGVPQFMVMGYLDGIPFVRYDSERGRMEPLTPWMKDGPEPGYWDRETRIAEGHQHLAIGNLEMLRGWYNQSRGLHTLQWVSGCDLLSDGSVRGFRRDGYDGRDFLSFDPGSKSFVAADSAAQVTTRRWNGDNNYIDYRMDDVEYTCREWLLKFVKYRKEELERKEPPDVHVSGKEEYGILTLFCHVYGFYPRTIAVSWMKGDEIRDQETQWGGIVPNSDGTFHTWARIEARPEEREQYRCRVEHPGMPEPGIFAWEPKSSVNLTLVVTLSLIAVIAVIAIGFGLWKLQSGRRQHSGYSPPAGTDVGTNGSTAGITA